jgi:hypothetical protein
MDWVDKALVVFVVAVLVAAGWAVFAIDRRYDNYRTECQSKGGHAKFFPRGGAICISEDGRIIEWR